MRLALPISVIVITSSCGPDTPARSQPPLTVALTAVASDVHSETTGDCIGGCGHGTRCNRASRRCERFGGTLHTLRARCDGAWKRWFEVQGTPSFSLADPSVNRLERTLAACTKLRFDPTPATQRCGSLEIDVALLEGDMVGDDHPDMIAARGTLDECASGSPHPGPGP